METIWKDIRYGARVLLGNPAFSLIALLALVLGIGANTAIFSVVNAVFLKPLPFPDPGRLVMVWEHRDQGDKTNVANPQNFLEWQARNRSFEKMAAFVETPFNITGPGTPEQVVGSYVTHDFFGILRISPALGRDFSAQEDSPGAPDVVLISDSLWKRRFGADPGIVGKQVALGSKSATIVGVAPSNFRFPGMKSELWELYTIKRAAQRGGRFLTGIARLKPGVSLDQAQADMDVIGAQLQREFPQFNTKWGVKILSMREQFVGELRTPLFVLLGAVGLVLLIACANVANLMLMRSSRRQREMAIRTSLGATRARVMRQLLIESGMLGLAAGAIGLAVAVWAKDGLVKMLPVDMSVARANGVSIDLNVLAFTLFVSVGTALLFGLLPALRSSRPDLSDSLKEGGRGVHGSLRKNRLRAVLAAAEMAIALTLLIGAGLLTKSFLRLASVPPGFRAEHVLTMHMTLNTPRYAKDDQIAPGLAEILRRVQRIPGVVSAGSVHFLPLGDGFAKTGFRIDGLPIPAPGQEPGTGVLTITPGYFAAMGIPVLRGRVFTDDDVAGKPQVTIITESFAKQFFPNENPIGRRLFVQWGKKTPYEIVGVVGDVKHEGLDRASYQTVYFTYAQDPNGFANLVIRTAVDPLSVARTVQSEIHAFDPQQAVADIQPLDVLVAESIQRPRFQSTLVGGFALLALLLASIGVFGVMAYSVAQRTHEIGIRMALGAERNQVVRLVVRQGLTIALLGVAGGLAGAWLLTRYLQTLLFGVSPTDPATFILLPVLLCAVSAAASYIPARRAATVDPIMALRYE